MGYHMMEYMGRLVRKTGIAVVIALLMLVLMGQAQSRRSMAAALEANAEVSPWSEEFSLRQDGQAVGLGTQTGAFPWNTQLKADGVEFWRADGRDYFAITCKDGTAFRGTRHEGTADTSNGQILKLYTENPAWDTYRGAHVGMDLEDVLSLYPEAEAVYDGHRDAGAYQYTYASTKNPRTQEQSVLSMTFRDSKLVSIVMAYG